METERFADEEGWELPLLRSPLIPEAFRHGFTTRAGGVSDPPYDTLNLGRRWGDESAHVLENRRRVERVAGARPLHVVTQVHGAAVACVRAGEVAVEMSHTRADALCTDAPGVALAVFVADCIPAVIADLRTGACAAVHAGWRGTLAGVLPAAVAELSARFGARPRDLRVALGPAIGGCCFEVGPEVVAAFAQVFPDLRRDEILVEPPSPAAKPRIDLERANRLLLERAGVPPQSIDAAGECTSCQRARFFSYRRDGGKTGQQIGFIVRR